MTTGASYSFQYSDITRLTPDDNYQYRNVNCGAIELCFADCISASSSMTGTSTSATSTATGRSSSRDRRPQENVGTALQRSYRAYALVLQQTMLALSKLRHGGVYVFRMEKRRHMPHEMYLNYWLLQNLFTVFETPDHAQAPAKRGARAQDGGSFYVVLKKFDQGKYDARQLPIIFMQGYLKLCKGGDLNLQNELTWFVSQDVHKQGNVVDAFIKR